MKKQIVGYLLGGMVSLLLIVNQPSQMRNNAEHPERAEMLKQMGLEQVTCRNVLANALGAYYHNAELVKRVICYSDDAAFEELLNGAYDSFLVS